MAQGEPPGRVGRLAFTNGTVSFHDDEQSELDAGRRQHAADHRRRHLDRAQRPQRDLAGRHAHPHGRRHPARHAGARRHARPACSSTRAASTSRPSRWTPASPTRSSTPRGTITLLQQGDYYVEAGSTQDPTRLGVRSGAAQIQAPERPGAGGARRRSRRGDGRRRHGRSCAPSNARRRRRLRLLGRAATARSSTTSRRNICRPASPATRISTSYGTWINDGGYGEVWVPRSVPSGWAPYRTGHWSYVQPWGWTWIDEQPWGFAPYHYGRWANRNNRWVWVPPQREARPVYAPALVAFVGGIELAATLSAARARAGRLVPARAARGLRAVLHDQPRLLPAHQPPGPGPGPGPRASAGSARNGTSRPRCRTASTPR